MLSDRLVAAIKRLEVQSSRSTVRFRSEIYALQESFMSFTQRYWIGDASHQDQARDLFRMLRRQLDTEATYRDLRSEIFDSVQYLDSDVLRRQTGSMHRLTAVTILGLIGTVATGFLGMNLIAAADAPLGTRLTIFGVVLASTALVILLVVVASRPLTALFDRISGEHRNGVEP
jgi:Mg2+ and Co2+ transporter CorA